MGWKHYAQWMPFTYCLWYQYWRLIKRYKNVWFKNAFVYSDPAAKTKIMTAGIKGGVTGREAETAPRLWRTPALCKWPVTASNSIQLKGSRAHLFLFLWRMSYVFSHRRTFPRQFEYMKERGLWWVVHKWDTGGGVRLSLSVQTLLFYSTKLIKQRAEISLRISDCRTYRLQHCFIDLISLSFSFTDSF